MSRKYINSLITLSSEGIKWYVINIHDTTSFYVRDNIKAIADGLCCCFSFQSHSEAFIMNKQLTLHCKFKLITKKYLDSAVNSLNLGTSFQSFYFFKFKWWRQIILESKTLFTDSIFAHTCLYKHQNSTGTGNDRFQIQVKVFLNRIFCCWKILFQEEWMLSWNVYDNKIIIIPSYSTETTWMLAIPISAMVCCLIFIMSN